MAALDEEELAELRETFDYNDLDGDGSIELDEFRTMLENLEAGLTAEEISTGFTEIDINRDGLIDFDEFIAWWRET